MHTHELTARRRADVPSRLRGQLQRRRILEHDARALAAIRDAVDRAKLGDQDALEEIYVIFAGNIYGYVCSIVRDEHEAEDVTQHVFAKLMTAMAGYEHRKVPFAAWILRVAHNAAIDHVRVRRRLASEDLAVVGDRPSEEAAVDGQGALRVALATLPEEQRRVVFMRHVVGLSPAEIAERLGKSENAVHGLHHRGRRALREQLVALGSAPTTLAA